MIVEGVSEEMARSTSDKFLQWDQIVKGNVLENGSSSQQRDALRLLEDPTVYMYAFFKDKYGGPLRFYPYQDVIGNDDHKRILFCASNQIGKSLFLCCKSLHYALTNPGKTVLMVSKTLPQSKDLLREIKRLLNTSELDYRSHVGDAENKTEIYFRHYDFKVNSEGKREEIELSQSRIICVPATEAALGYAVDLLLIDELAFYEDGEYFFYQIAQPRTYETRGQIVVFSNPNGQQGIFWKLWNDDAFHRYRFNFLDCPRNTEEMYLDLKKKLSREVFDSTVDAKFTSPAGGFFSYEERKAMQEERQNQWPSFPVSPIFIFFDWGKSHDHTVRAIATSHGTIENPYVYVHELKEYPQGTPYTEILDDLKIVLETVGHGKVAQVGWDNTGVGRGIEDFAKTIVELGFACTPIDFTLENKSAIYLTFKLLAERNVRGEPSIKIPKIDRCDDQLSALRFKRTTRGHWQVHHENESDRDDYCDALAGVCGLIVNPGVVPVTLTIVDEASKDDDATACPRCEFTIGKSKTCKICGFIVEEV